MLTKEFVFSDVKKLSHVNPLTVKIKYVLLQYSNYSCKYSWTSITNKCWVNLFINSTTTKLLFDKASLRCGLAVPLSLSKHSHKCVYDTTKINVLWSYTLQSNIPKIHYSTFYGKINACKSWFWCAMKTLKYWQLPI